MKIDVDPKALREFADLLQSWTQMDEEDPDDKNWKDNTEKTMALQAMTWDLLDLLGEPTPERNDAIKSYLSKNKYYRPMTSP